MGVEESNARNGITVVCASYLPDDKSTEEQRRADRKEKE